MDKFSSSVGQNLLLNVYKFILPEGLTLMFMSKHGALFSSVEQVFKDIYNLELQPEIKVHPTFYVSFLKPFKDDTLWPDHKHVIRPPPDLVEVIWNMGEEGILK